MNLPTPKQVKSIYKIRLKDDVANFTKILFYGLFEADEVREKELSKARKLFLEITSTLQIENVKGRWDDFSFKFPQLRDKLDKDAIAIEQHDPAAKSLEEIYLAYPGFHAIAIYRSSHELFKLKMPIIPRMMSEYVHGITGIDIHPGATIGESFYIDHGTGIVIGETSIINKNVKIYQGVTLGGLQVNKNLASTKRHPTIQENVTIYANATILGGDIVIGANSTIGANVWITESIPENSVVTYKTEIKIRPKKNGIR